MAANFIRVTLWLVIAAGRLIVVIVRIGGRLAMVIMGGVFILTGLAFGTTFLGGVCGLPMTIFGFLLMAYGML